MEIEEQLTEYVREGQYLAEVEVACLFDERRFTSKIRDGEAEKLENVRRAMRAGDLKAAAKLATIYELSPIAA